MAIRVSSRRLSDSRAVWFAAGFGIAAIIALTLNLNSTDSVRQSTKSRCSELARLIAAPLIPKGQVRPEQSEAEVLAALAKRYSAAKSLANYDSELGSIAGDYAKAIGALQDVLYDAPSAIPLGRAGLQAIKSGVDGGSKGFFLGLLGVGAEMSKLSEWAERVVPIHTRIVACRLRLADLVSDSASPVARGDMVVSQFLQSGATEQNDMLVLTNVSGMALTNVVVIVELVGRTGETFKNLYHAGQWDSNKAMVAECQSAQPGRETVHAVRRVKFRVIAAERSSRPSEIVVNQ